MSYTIVLLNLDQDQERERVWWARDNCPSFDAWYIYEDADNHIENEEWNTEFKFMFNDEKDAMMFQLRWQGHDSE